MLRQVSKSPAVDYPRRNGRRKGRRKAGPRPAPQAVARVPGPTLFRFMSRRPAARRPVTEGLVLRRQPAALGVAPARGDQEGGRVDGWEGGRAREAGREAEKEE